RKNYFGCISSLLFKKIAIVKWNIEQKKRSLYFFYINNENENRSMHITTCKIDENSFFDNGETLAKFVQYLKNQCWMYVKQ
ncbi:hypothetical protein RFI_02511, partial [Reticulomyxa filosa]